MLTARLSRVALPDHADQKYGHDLLPALLEPGTYSVRSEHSEPPWEVDAEARGVHLQVYSLSYGPPGLVGVAPGDVRGTALIRERCDGCCCGLDGRSGSNLACVESGWPWRPALTTAGSGRWCGWIHEPCARSASMVRLTP
ncbi:hypothetical protein LDL08_01110 [Nonomuraea glycinis]|uniref:Uncharacterized protein n=1 Tax=Nonomuraea glycinis TaxID=2047744 RepID=A0A917ZZ85_9ACTN|nr:hypothetical protein [Nonomuraea glycinis]MCA2174776.1 hypothetical protein [Nonomuraea glycinis]GGP01689.1 hypothetical protein GCM10012278_05930 [Nonomuraea glycinis]